MMHSPQGGLSAGYDLVATVTYTGVRSQKSKFVHLKSTSNFRAL